MTTRKPRDILIRNSHNDRQALLSDFDNKKKRARKERLA
jgi:hypothetical protein